MPKTPGVTFATQGDWMQEACLTAEFDCPATEAEGMDCTPSTGLYDILPPTTAIIDYAIGFGKLLAKARS